MKPKVLMLGWEYPPFFNGGLGVACAGIADALAANTDLTMIVPRTGPVYNLPAYELIGLHQRMIPARSIESKKVYETLEERVKMTYVEVDLSGYERVPPIVRGVPIGKEILTIKKVISETSTVPEELFEIEELYGTDLHLRIQQYSSLVRAQAQELEFDLIHAHDWMTFLAGMELKALYQKPLILHIHSLSYDREGATTRGFAYEIERHAMQQADAIIPVSHYTATNIQTYYGIPSDKLFPIYNGISRQKAYRTPKPFRQKLVVFLGRLTEQKGPLYFLQAAKHLLKQNANIRFIVAGKGELIDQMIQETAAAKIGDRVHFTGFLDPDRVQDLLAMADAYVMPSISEPFGLAALEAAQMEVPCIISPQAGVGEVLTHAVQVDYTDAEKLANTIFGLVEDEFWRKEVIAGQLSDLEGISWEGTAKEIRMVYQNLLDR